MILAIINTYHLEAPSYAFELVVFVAAVFVVAVVDVFDPRTD